ncbi:hypothetical protein ABK040_001586 [Willaertia magna]
MFLYLFDKCCDVYCHVTCNLIFCNYHWCCCYHCCNDDVSELEKTLNEIEIKDEKTNETRPLTIDEKVLKRKEIRHKRNKEIERWIYLLITIGFIYMILLPFLYSTFWLDIFQFYPEKNFTERLSSLSLGFYREIQWRSINWFYYFFLVSSVVCWVAYEWAKRSNPGILKEEKVKEEHVKKEREERKKKDIIKELTKNQIDVESFVLLHSPRSSDVSSPNNSSSNPFSPRNRSPSNANGGSSLRRRRLSSAAEIPNKTVSEIFHVEERKEDEEKEKKEENKEINKENNIIKDKKEEDNRLIDKKESKTIDTTYLRSKYCSRCKARILKFDHHCFWTGNCVGEKNQWIFILFLFILAFHMFICLCFIIYYFVFFFQEASLRLNMTSELEKRKKMAEMYGKKITEVWGEEQMKMFLQNSTLFNNFIFFGFCFVNLFNLFLSLIILIFSMFLIGVQGYLISTNQTSLEYFEPKKTKYVKSKEVSQYGFKKNISLFIQQIMLPKDQHMQW